MTRGRYRWRAWTRQRLPWFLINRGVAAKGRGECGAHRFYRHTADLDRCYYCEAGESAHDPARFS